MNSKQIEMVLAVEQTLNFTKAADMLYLSQPTLTYQIQALESEVGFKIFDRSQKSVAITPAGKTFLKALSRLAADYKTAVEQAQNYSESYDEDITLSLPYRSAVHLLPQAIQKMKAAHPTTLIVPKFHTRESVALFLRGEADVAFGDFDVMKHAQGVNCIPLYESKIYLVCHKNDPLAVKRIITANDLRGRTLMVGGGSQKPLQAVQKRVIEQTRIPFFNSDDHETTLTNIAAGRGVVLAPGFLRDRGDADFRWIPFDCDEVLRCCLCVKENESRAAVKDFIQILLKLYENETEL